jgi:outer membrane biogenesis lipoprotein LolB
MHPHRNHRPKAALTLAALAALLLAACSGSGGSRAPVK